jgi:type I restriction enzyme M protein
MLTYNKAFLEIRNYLAGRALGISNDRALLHEVLKLLFCKMALNGEMRPSLDVTETASTYREAFAGIKKRLPDSFGTKEEILLDPQSLVAVDTIFGRTNLKDLEKDPLSILYQTFVGSDYRGAEGQFFTPFEAVKWLVEAIEPSSGERIIDPACGSGSFLSYAARFMSARGVSQSSIAKNIFGVEKDEYLANLARTHLSLITFAHSNISCGDSITRQRTSGDALDVLEDGGFDVVLANPPFGSKIVVGDVTTNKQFELAHKWTKAKGSSTYHRTHDLAKNPTPQVLFIELFLKLLKPGGRFGVVVPESLLSGSGTSHVVQFMQERASISTVIGMPEDLFKTSGKGGTHTKTCLLIAEKKRSKRTKQAQIYMAEARWCGHDSRANTIARNDLPQALNEFRKCTPTATGSLGYWMDTKDVVAHRLVPRYYHPDASSSVNALSNTHHLLNLGELIDSGAIDVRTGDEVGKVAYGTGTIPFVRTSDISNWEIKLDPKHLVSEAVYNKVRHKQDVREGDILMVKDGTYLVGVCAYVSEYDTKMVYQSHIFKFRLNDHSVLSPYLLLAALSSKAVKEQIAAKRFTLDIIDSLGSRVRELVLPIPKDAVVRKRIEEMVKRAIHDRLESRELSRMAMQEIDAPVEVVKVKRRRVLEEA